MDQPQSLDCLQVPGLVFAKTSSPGMRAVAPFAFITFLVVLGQITKSYWGWAGPIAVLAGTGLLWFILWLITRFFESRTRVLEQELAELEAKSEDANRSSS